ncbi:MAG TPA: HAMP domain-containing sensor histidine kinase, partial [Candidatus Angelobacter sp.]
NPSEEGSVSNQGSASPSLPGESGHHASESASDERLKQEVFRRTLLLASAAHELKTPLAVITGYADFLLADHAGPLNQQQRNILGEMQQSALRLQTLIEGFLKFSALESGNVEIRKELRDVNKCVEEVIAQWQIPYAARGTMIEFFPDPDLDPVWIDSIKLQNILSNLLDNALKFSPPFGRVTVMTSVDCWERRISQDETKIHLERRIFAGEAHPNCVRIDVADNGGGIPPEYHSAIFDEFRQIEQVARTQGIGLGLSIARKLAEAHGGKVLVKSTVGEGSTFSVLLPRQ